MQILTFFERQKIEYYLRLKFSKRAIAGKLKRNHSIIVREISRNTKSNGKYQAITAQEKADKRAKKTNKSKLDKDEELKRYVVARMKGGWSPEQIAGRLKTHPPKSMQEKYINHESIYQYIYKESGENKYLFNYLRKGRKNRRKKCARKPRKDTIIERISIHLRPDSINERKEYGHWESNSMIFRKQRSALNVQYERKSQLVALYKLANKSAEETEAAITKNIESLPEDFMKSATFDNGSENAKHYRLKKDFGIETYFCDPYASWQKGGVENINGLIRQYLPRKINLATIADSEIKEIQESLNNRPRKSLDYLTPNEIFAEQTNSLGGALNP